MAARWAGLCVAWVAPFAGAAHGAVPAPEATFDVTQYGAVADGRTICTAAIQRAIDGCAAAGGGSVVIPAGSFLTGTLRLRSGVTLHLQAHATLLGSPNVVDYPPTRPATVRSFNDGRTQMNLIYGENLTNVAITGTGTIDGQGGAWPKRPRGAGDRPFGLRFVACHGVRIEGVTLRNSGFWMQHYLECDDVTVRNVRVFNHANWNNDAIDIDGCHRVLIEGLRSDTSDDGITLKSTTLRANEDVTVRNCEVRTHAVGLKFGTETIGGFHHIRIDGCDVDRSTVEHDAFGGRLGGKGGIAIMSLDGAPIDDVEISNIRIHGTLSPIFIRLQDRGREAEKGRRKPIGSVRHVVLRDIVATGAEITGSLVAGVPGHPIEALTLRNVHLETVGGARLADVKLASDELATAGGAGPGMFGTLPASGLFFYHVDGLTLDHVTITAVRPDARPPIALCDTHDVVVDGVPVQPDSTKMDGLTFLAHYVVPTARL